MNLSQSKVQQEGKQDDAFWWYLTEDCSMHTQISESWSRYKNFLQAVSLSPENITFLLSASVSSETMLYSIVTAARLKHAGHQAVTEATLTMG